MMADVGIIVQADELHAMQRIQNDRFLVMFKSISSEFKEETSTEHI